jgi:DNA (cytosine-5)-methyltransferase 1
LTAGLLEVGESIDSPFLLPNLGRAYRIGSLFAGTGALDMAVSSVIDAEPAWFVEFDEAPSKILAHHWPHVPNYGDVTTVDWSKVPDVDIITGGSPCQDLSNAGARKGMTEGTRSNLWVNMREAIAIKRPRIVFWENVRGALSAKAASEVEQSGRLLVEDGKPGLRALGRVLGDLADLGYDAQWRLVRAGDKVSEGIGVTQAGAPHRRERVFVVAQNADFAAGN